MARSVPLGSMAPFIAYSPPSNGQIALDWKRQALIVDIRLQSRIDLSEEHGTGIIVRIGDQAAQCGSSRVTEHELVGRRKSEHLHGRTDRDVAEARSGN